jgi:hypothetical protein
MSSSKNTGLAASPTRRAVLVAAGLVLIYAVLIFLLPPSRETMQTYDFGPWQYRIVRLALALPALAAWLAAFLAYASLRRYAHTIRKTPEGGHFDRLATGAGWLAWSLPVTMIGALILSSIGNRWTDFHPAAVIIINYVALLLPLIAFSIIGGATRDLATYAKLKVSLANVRVIMLLFLAAGVSYCLLTFRQFNPTSLTSTDNPYYLPIWLMVLTVIVPYLYAWFVGLLAAYELTLFSKRINGVLYRQALGLLVGGLVAVIGSAITVQYFNSVDPRYGNLVFDYRLLLILLCRLVAVAGFVMIAAGALRLKKIEEV